jgi:hypothetical protein
MLREIILIIAVTVKELNRSNLAFRREDIGLEGGDAGCFSGFDYSRIAAMGLNAHSLHLLFPISPTERGQAASAALTPIPRDTGAARVNGRFRLTSCNPGCRRR